MQIRFSVGFASPFSCTYEFSDGFPQVDLAHLFFSCKTFVLVNEKCGLQSLPPSLFRLVVVIVVVIDYHPSTTCMFPSFVLWSSAHHLHLASVLLVVQHITKVLHHIYIIDVVESLRLFSCRLQALEPQAIEPQARTIMTGFLSARHSWFPLHVLTIPVWCS